MNCPPGCSCGKHGGGFKGQALTEPCPEGCTCGRHNKKIAANPGYMAFHKRLRKARGSAQNFTCPCGAPAKQWSYNHTGLTLLCSDTGFKYSLDFEDYTARCVPCHKFLDALMGGHG